jgi:hypothetical protein
MSDATRKLLSGPRPVSGHSGQSNRTGNADLERGETWAVTETEHKPIREVLADRKCKHADQDKAIRYAAFKTRSRIQALMHQCLCCYPLEIADTESQHDEWCPAHALFLSFKIVDERANDRG